jgi:hypothetical protein
MRILLSCPILLAAFQAPLPAQNPPPKSDIPYECQDVLKDLPTFLWVLLNDLTESSFASAWL